MNPINLELSLIDRLDEMGTSQGDHLGHLEHRPSLKDRLSIPINRKRPRGRSASPELGINLSREPRRPFKLSRKPSLSSRISESLTLENKKLSDVCIPFSVVTPPEVLPNDSEDLIPSGTGRTTYSTGSQHRDQNSRWNPKPRRQHGWRGSKHRSSQGSTCRVWG